MIKPTKIYVKELNKINKKKLINGCANITGGGLINNLIRIIPKNNPKEQIVISKFANKFFAFAKHFKSVAINYLNIA